MKPKATIIFSQESKDKIKKTMERLEQLNEEKREIENKIAKHREKIASKMQKYNYENFYVDNDEDTLLKESMIEKTKYIYDFDAILESLDKEQRKAVISKSYEIDSKAYKKLLKRHPELKKELKKIITVNKEIDQEKLANAIQSGIISIDSIKEHITEETSKQMLFKRIKRPDEW